VGAFFVVILAVFFGGAYFIPASIAFYRGHQSVLGVFLLNFFLGWTFVGWIVALVWAMSGKPQKAQTYAQSIA
jgi:hypothetical protein